MRTERASLFVLFSAFWLVLAAVPAHAGWPAGAYNGGLQVSSSSFGDTYPASAPDGSGGLFLSWVDGLNGVVVQHLDADGEPVWTAGGVLLGGSPAIGQTEVVADGAGGAIVSWSDERNFSDAVVYAQRVDAAGAAQWIAGGVQVQSPGIPQVAYFTSRIRAVPDGAGGAVLCWRSVSTAFGSEDLPVVTAQRVSAAGAKLWGAAGLPMSVQGGAQENPVILGDGAGGAFVVWEDTRAILSAIYGQRLDSAGVRQWGADGLAIAAPANGATHPAIASDGASGLIATWEDYRNYPGNGTDVYAQRMSPFGNPYWGGSTVVCIAAAGQERPVVVPDGAGGAVFAWWDGRSAGDQGFYAQRFGASGAAQWPANGVLLCTGTSARSSLGLAGDGAGGAIASWADFRSGRADVYARRVSTSGTPLWQANGTPIVLAADGQDLPVIAGDGRGGALLAWQDVRAGQANVYAQRVDSLGFLGDPAPRITSVLDIPNDQGGKVKVSWAASTQDGPYAPADLHYEVLRLEGPGTWVAVGTQPSGPLAEYSLVCATAADSGATIPHATFRVRARTGFGGGDPFWESPADSGYSVDDLSPPAPSALEGRYESGVTTLSWTAVAAPDLAGYRVYRGASPDFEPTAARLVASTAATAWTDAAGAAWIYRVTAVDTHGNESPAATFVPDATLGVVGAAPGAVAFAAPSPNPARDAASLGFALSRAAGVSLAIFDAGGRLVRELVAGPRPAGEQRVAWDLRDTGGAVVPPGLYFASLRVEGTTLTRRVVVVK